MYWIDVDTLFLGFDFPAPIFKHVNNAAFIISRHFDSSADLTTGMPTNANIQGRAKKKLIFRYG